MSVEVSKCCSCGVVKPLDDFYLKTSPNGKRYRCHRCKACHIKRVQRDTYARNHYKPPAPRTPSIECKFTCPTCGMGFDAEREALVCCKRLEA